MNFIIFLNSFIIYSPIHNSTNFQLMTNLSANCDGKNPSPSSDEFAQCVENISVLNLRLKNADERCQLLKADLRQAKQVCEIDFTIDFVKSISRNFREIDFIDHNHHQSPRSPNTNNNFTSFLVSSTKKKFLKKITRENHQHIRETYPTTTLHHFA